MREANTSMDMVEGLRWVHKQTPLNKPSWVLLYFPLLAELQRDVTVDHRYIIDLVSQLCNHSFGNRN